VLGGDDDRRGRRETVLLDRVGHLLELGVDVVECAGQQRARRRSAGEVAGELGRPLRVAAFAFWVRVLGESTFSATDTVWKFIPRIAGTPSFWVPLWS